MTKKTEEDGQWSAYRDFLKRRNSAMRALLKMPDKGESESQISRQQARTDPRAGRLLSLVAPET